MGTIVWFSCLLLRLFFCQRAPSGFNLQPYVAVVVTDEPTKAQLADATFGGNRDRLLEAPVAVVFAADLGKLYTVVTVSAFH